MFCKCVILSLMGVTAFEDSAYIKCVLEGLYVLNIHVYG